VIVCEVRGFTHVHLEIEWHWILDRRFVGAGPCLNKPSIANSPPSLSQVCQ